MAVVTILARKTLKEERETFSFYHSLRSTSRYSFGFGENFVEQEAQFSCPSVLILKIFLPFVMSKKISEFDSDTPPRWLIKNPSFCTLPLAIVTSDNSYCHSLIIFNQKKENAAKE